MRELSSLLPGRKGYPRRAGKVGLGRWAHRAGSGRATALLALLRGLLDLHGFPFTQVVVWRGADAIVGLETSEHLHGRSVVFTDGDVLEMYFVSLVHDDNLRSVGARQKRGIRDHEKTLSFWKRYLDIPEHSRAQNLSRIVELNFAYQRARGRIERDCGLRDDSGEGTQWHRLRRHLRSLAHLDVVGIFLWYVEVNAQAR